MSSELRNASKAHTQGQGWREGMKRGTWAPEGRKQGERWVCKVRGGSRKRNEDHTQRKRDAHWHRTSDPSRGHVPNHGSNRAAPGGERGGGPKCAGEVGADGTGLSHPKGSRAEKEKMKLGTEPNGEVC